MLTNIGQVVKIILHFEMPNPSIKNHGGKLLSALRVNTFDFGGAFSLYWDSNAFAMFQHFSSIDRSTLFI